MTPSCCKHIFMVYCLHGERSMWSNLSKPLTIKCNTEQEKGLENKFYFICMLYLFIKSLNEVVFAAIGNSFISFLCCRCGTIVTSHTSFLPWTFTWGYINLYYIIFIFTYTLIYTVKTENPRNTVYFCFIYPKITASKSFWLYVNLTYWPGLVFVRILSDKKLKIQFYGLID